MISEHPETLNTQERIFSLSELTSRNLPYSVDDLYADVGYKLQITLQYSGFKDRDGEEIYEGDLIEVLREDGVTIPVICKFGTAIREIFDNEIEIHGFYFQTPDLKKTFPITNNYAGKHDTELFLKVGNVFYNK